MSTIKTTHQNGSSSPPSFPELNIRDLSFHEEAKKFVYAWLRSQNTPQYDEAARKMNFVFDAEHLYSLLREHKFDEANSILTAFIPPSITTSEVYHVFYTRLFAISLKNDQDLFNAAHKLFSITGDPSFLTRLVRDSIRREDLPQIDLDKCANEIIEDLMTKLPKYNLPSFCPEFDMEVIYKPFKKPEEVARPVTVENREAESEKVMDDLMRAFGIGKRERPVENGELDDSTKAKKPKTHNNPVVTQPQSNLTQTIKQSPVASQQPQQVLQPQQAKQQTPATATASTPVKPTTNQTSVATPTSTTTTTTTTIADTPRNTAQIPATEVPSPTSAPQITPRTYPIVAQDLCCQMIAHNVLARTPNPGKLKQLIPGFQGTCLAGIQEKEKLFFLYWSPMTFDNKEVSNLNISRISTLSHPFVAITTTDSYFMAYGANQEGTLIKVARSTQQSVRNKSPKEIDIKVLISDPLSPAALPTYAVFCPFDNNYVFAGFSSGNIAVGRVNNNTFQPFSIFRSNPETDKGEICSIDCFSMGSSEVLSLAFATKGGSIKLMECSVQKKNNLCDIRPNGTETLFSSTEIDVVSPPTVKFHPLGRLILIKRERTVLLYSLDTKQVHEQPVNNVLFAAFSSIGQRVVTIDASNFSCFRLDGVSLRHEFSFSLSDFNNKYGSISSVTTNPERRDNTDFVVGTDRGFLVSIRLRQ